MDLDFHRWTNSNELRVCSICGCFCVSMDNVRILRPCSPRMVLDHSIKLPEKEEQQIARTHINARAYQKSHTNEINTRILPSSRYNITFSSFWKQ